MSKNLFRCAMAAAAIMSAASEIRAQTSPTDISTEIVVGHVSTQDDPYTGWLGVRVRLGPGWKIYWKSPGDTGLPPEFDWSASFNVVSAEVQWPLPHRTSILGIDSVGYTGEVLFPVKIHIEEPDYDARADLKLVLYACSNICIREERELKADLSRPSSPDAQAQIDEWRDRIPQQKSASLTIAAVELLRATPPRIRVEASAAQPLANPELFVAGPSGTYAGKPDVQISGNRTVLTATLQSPSDDPEALSNLTVTVADGPLAVEAAVPSSALPPSKTPRETHESDSWLAVIATALLGGLILNAMPCVFPVLSLKLLGFVNYDAARRRTFRLGFIASASGVVLSFLTLASALVALKATGAMVGWGIQFQQPLFLAVMAAVTTLFAANLLGLLEISLPLGLLNALARRGIGSSIPSHFASGFVATMLATPCSAPFVGTAVSYALSHGTFETYSVFTALGIGMAAPNLLIACVPNLATFLPRPGPWMLWLKRALAIPLLATAVWLIVLVGTTAGLVSAALTAAALSVGLVALWWRATDPSPDAAIAVSSALVLAGACVMVAAIQLTRITEAGARQIQWRPFAELDELVRSGQTVFLDVTADWCVTCKVNKALVVNSQAITQRLSNDVVPVQGDWTRPDPRIALYLKSHGRYGLPFNIVFGPGAPDGIVLPELLTTDAVLTAFATSSGHAAATIESK